MNETVLTQTQAQAQNPQTQHPQSKDRYVKKVTYQGVIGCFSSITCEEVFPTAIHRSCVSFGDAMQSVCLGDADLAVLPVENSTAGRVTEVYGLLPESSLSIIGEYFLPIHHCLMMPTKFVRGLPPQNVSEDELLEWKRSKPTQAEIEKAFNSISEVRSHPQGLSQCKDFLRSNLPNARQRESWDTAGAARDLAQEMTPNIAVIAPIAAVRYGMTILRENIEDDKGNTTRFLFLRSTPLAKEEITLPCLTTLVFTTKHEAGALVKALEIFQENQINMTKLETYMTGIHHSEPVFYVDVAMNQFDEIGKKTLSELKEKTMSLEILGTYGTSLSRWETF